MNENRYSDSLAHYGVKGMKWGVRRSVNGVSNFLSSPAGRVTAYGLGMAGVMAYQRSKNKQRRAKTEELNRHMQSKDLGRKVFMVGVPGYREPVRMTGTELKRYAKSGGVVDIDKTYLHEVRPAKKTRSRKKRPS